jgi:mono/diheme cytochrome c family protein
MRAKRWSPRAALRPALLLILFLASAVVGVSIAQTPPRRTVWDGVYSQAQADRGMTAFGQSCAGCHALAAEGKAPLVGDPFWKSFSQKSVGELLEFVSAYMPNGAPGSLNAGTYADIIALMLRSNGFPAGMTELEPGAVADVRIVPKDGSAELPANALARVIGCLANNGAGWVVTSATDPERAERASAPAEDATRPLGSRTMPLKFVVTKLDSLIGSRVAVTGLLMGAGGIDGINVTTVSRIAPKCP